MEVEKAYITATIPPTPFFQKIRAMILQARQGGKAELSVSMGLDAWNEFILTFPPYFLAGAELATDGLSITVDSVALNHDASMAARRAVLKSAGVLYVWTELDERQEARAMQ